MPSIKITKAEFLSLYENTRLTGIFSVEVGTVTRVYGKTDNQVVYCEV